MNKVRRGGSLKPVNFRDEKTVSGIGGRAVKLVNHPTHFVRPTLCWLCHIYFPARVVSRSTRNFLCLGANVLD